MLFNCGVGENSWESLEIQLQGDPTARRSNQSILKEISPGCSLEGLMLKLKLQYFGHLMQRADSFEKTLMLGKIEGRKGRELQGMRWLDGISNQWTWVWVNYKGWWWTGRPSILWILGSQRIGHDWVNELNWIRCFPWELPKLSLHCLLKEIIIFILTWRIIAFQCCVGFCHTSTWVSFCHTSTWISHRYA